MCVVMSGYEGDGNAAVGDGGGVVGKSAGHEYVGGIRGSGIATNAADVLAMGMVRGMSGVCEKCLCLARGGVGCE